MRRPRFLDGMGFLDALLTSALVFGVVLAVTMVLYRAYLR